MGWNMQKVIVVTVKGDHRYTVQSDKSVCQILKEISKNKSEFYMLNENCAIRNSEVVSVEHFEVELPKND